MTNPEPRTRSRFTTPIIIFIIAVVLVLLSIGLCNAGHFNLEGSSSGTANAGLLCFFAGLLAGIVSVLWLIIVAITGGGRPH